MLNAAYLTILLVLLAGCTHTGSTGYFTIVGLDSSLRPRFCMSEKPDCSGMGVAPERVAVVEVPENGATEQRHTVWAIHPLKEEDLERLLVYGGTPVGWVLDVGPEPLRIGPVYEIGQLRFRFKQEGEEVKYEVVPPPDQSK